MTAMAQSEQEDESGGEEPPDIDGDGHCVPESEMLVVRDRNMDYPWKDGNKYSRRCPECGAMQFCAKGYWQTRFHDVDSTAHVIKKGGEEPKPAYPCPYGDCDGVLVGEPDECPTCEQEIEWEE